MQSMVFLLQQPTVTETVGWCSVASHVQLFEMMLIYIYKASLVAQR